MQAIKRPTTETPSFTVTEKTPPRGLSMNWQVVDGKLICAWVKNPDSTSSSDVLVPLINLGKRPPCKRYEAPLT